MANNLKSIGVFDSGVGGLSIYRELTKLMPNEHFIYLADSANAPYGERSPEEIKTLVFRNTQFLIDQGAKLVVVACNTATTMAIQELRQSFHVPFIGIEPAIKPAALNSSIKKVGVLATKGTLNSPLFKETSATYGKSVETITVVGKGLVQLIESGKTNSEEMTELLKEYLAPMIQAKVDHIVLGCTHYPFLKEQIQTLTPRTVKIIDSGKPVAKQTQRILAKYHLGANETANEPHAFYVNGNTAVCESFLRQMGISNYTIRSL